MITAAIDSHERINVAVFEILGAHLHTDSDEDFIMALEGVLDGLMVKVNPLIHIKYVTVNSKGKSLLYVKMH